VLIGKDLEPKTVDGLWSAFLGQQAA
jgi:hypothetical protein